MSKLRQMGREIELDKYYRPLQLLALSPIIEAKGYDWLLTVIRSGKLKSVNTNKNGSAPRYLVKGEDIINFISAEFNV